jgi:hypothetical protein
MPGDVDQTFMENLSALEPCPALMKKIIIPDILRATVLAELARMNVTAASLFPGLDGFARSMYSYLALPRLDRLDLTDVPQPDAP